MRSTSQTTPTENDTHHATSALDTKSHHNNTHAVATFANAKRAVRHPSATSTFACSTARQRGALPSRGGPARVNRVQPTTQTTLFGVLRSAAAPRPPNTTDGRKQGAPPFGRSTSQNAKPNGAALLRVSDHSENVPYERAVSTTRAPLPATRPGTGQGPLRRAHVKPSATTATKRSPDARAEGSTSQQQDGSAVLHGSKTSGIGGNGVSCVCGTLSLRHVISQNPKLLKWLRSPVGEALQAETLTCKMCGTSGHHGLCNAFAWRYDPSDYGDSDECSRGSGVANKENRLLANRQKTASSQRFPDRSAKIAKISTERSASSKTSYASDSTHQEVMQRSVRAPHGPLLEPAAAAKPSTSRVLKELRENFTCHACKINCMNPAEEVIYGLKTKRLIAPSDPTTKVDGNSAFEGELQVDFSLPPDVEMKSQDWQLQLRVVSLSQLLPGRRHKWPKNFSIELNVPRRFGGSSSSSCPKTASSSSKGARYEAVYDPVHSFKFPKEPYSLPKEELYPPQGKKTNVLTMKYSRDPCEALLCQIVAVRKLSKTADPSEVLLQRIMSENVLAYEEGKEHAIKWYTKPSGGSAKIGGADDEDEDDEDDDAEVFIVDAPERRVSVICADESGDSDGPSPEVPGDSRQAAETSSLKKLLKADNTGFALPLVCMDSSVRLQIAARSRHCRHVHCFDLQFFLRHNLRFGAAGKNVWRCGRCGASCYPHEIIVDEFVNSFLRQTDESAIEVLFRSGCEKGFSDFEVSKHTQVESDADVHEDDDDDVDDYRNSGVADYAEGDVRSRPSAGSADDVEGVCAVVVALSDDDDDNEAS